ncbi:MAG: glycosyltransferase family 2 protein [Chroococcidiopsidaceae cyanobacterium CP_BM_ER_R8_30]|nr:glycosyltransferase family 2 protein [Chroococcidiopsidaceae cyanobacterium CP_BM_ER_R8_30]
MISIVIPTLNREHSLSLALESLVQQDFPADQFEILIVDNGSTDTTQATSKQFIDQHPSCQIRYVYEPEPGLLSGRHRGALEAAGDILVFIDDDIVADVNWLQAIHEAFSDNTVQLVGGRNLPKYEVEPPGWLDWFWYEYAGGKFCAFLSLADLGDSAREIDPLCIWGLNFSIRKQALFDLGGFHPDNVPSHLQKFQGDGESGLAAKAANRGYKAMYHPGALVFHQTPRTRMTYKYFEQRSFSQGVSDSYSAIRKNGRNKFRLVLRESLKGMRNSLNDWRAFLKSHFSSSKEVSQERRMLGELTSQAYRNGYQFHQNAVRTDPILFDWVLRENYWDYKLPKNS